MVNLKKNFSEFDEKLDIQYEYESPRSKTNVPPFTLEIIVTTDNSGANFYLRYSTFMRFWNKVTGMYVLLPAYGHVYGGFGNFCVISDMVTYAYRRWMPLFNKAEAINYHWLGTTAFTAITNATITNLFEHPTEYFPQMNAVAGTAECNATADFYDYMYAYQTFTAEGTGWWEASVPGVGYKFPSGLDYVSYYEWKRAAEFNLIRLAKKYRGLFSINKNQVNVSFNDPLNLESVAESKTSEELSWSEENWVFDPEIATGYFGNIGFLTPATFEFWGLSIEFYKKYCILVGNVSNTLIDDWTKDTYTVEFTPVVLMTPLPAFGREVETIPYTSRDIDKLHSIIAPALIKYTRRVALTQVGYCWYWDGEKFYGRGLSKLHEGNLTEFSIIGVANNRISKIMKKGTQVALATVLFAGLRIALSLSGVLTAVKQWWGATRVMAAQKYLTSLKTFAEDI